MVLGEYSEHEIEKMASSKELTDFYLDYIRDDIDESDNVIINLALEHFINDLEDESIEDWEIICKECLIIEYLHLHKKARQNENYTLNELLENANKNW